MSFREKKVTINGLIEICFNIAILLYVKRDKI